MTTNTFGIDETKPHPALPHLGPYKTWRDKLVAELSEKAATMNMSWWEYLLTAHEEANTDPPTDSTVNINDHYRLLSPQPIEVMQKWGLTFPFAIATILKLTARIWSTNRPDSPASGHNGRGSLEDIVKLRFYVDEVEQYLLSKAPEGTTQRKASPRE